MQLRRVGYSKVRRGIRRFRILQTHPRRGDVGGLNISKYFKRLHTAFHLRNFRFLNIIENIIISYNICDYVTRCRKNAHFLNYKRLKIITA